MINYELTEEEVRVINKLREKQKINKKELDNLINKFLDESYEFRNTVCSLYELVQTNNKAREIIKQTVCTEYLYELYEIINKEDD